MARGCTARPATGRVLGTGAMSFKPAIIVLFGRILGVRAAWAQRGAMFVLSFSLLGLAVESKLLLLQISALTFVFFLSLARELSSPCTS